MQLQPVTVDFETYYDQDYSLRKIKTALYIRDDRFKVQGVGIKVGRARTHYYKTAESIRSALSNVSWSSSILVGHNLTFDGLILNDVYGHRPAQYFDTKSIANVLLPSSERKTLENSAIRILGVKQGKLTGLDKTKGKRTLTEEENEILKKYCIQDVELTYKLYDLLKDVLPEQERYLMSLTARMAAEPVLQLDTDLLADEIQRLEDHRNDVLSRCPVSQKVLSSNPQFARWIESQGLKVPMKVGKSKDKVTGKPTGKLTYAFAQTDLAYRELQVDNPQFAIVWEARALVKSTIELTRARAFYEIGLKGAMPMPLNYYGAHTGRWSGADGLNVQNLPRYNPNNPASGVLRRSIYAPDGFSVVVVDSAQIELRLNAWFCGELNKLDILRNGGDVYLYAASNHYGYECNKEDHIHERFFGKMLELALGYNMGWRKLRVNAALGFMGTPPVHLSQLEAQNAVNKWRSVNEKTKAMWEKLNSLIPRIKDSKPYEFNGLIFGHGGITLPNGMVLHYNNLRWDEEDASWVYDGGKKLYGGIILENIIQALARIVIAEQIYTVDQKAKIRVVSSTHDEIIAICKTEYASGVYAYINKVMSTPPAWAPDLPLAAEGGWAKNYSK